MFEPMDVVTIDGPSGGGKSTVSRGVAARLGFTYLDTGAMYRAVAYGCRQEGIDPEDTTALSAFLERLNIDLRPAIAKDSDVQVFVNGREVGQELRTPEMGMLASRVSALPPVRAHLTRMQQEMGNEGGIVAEGRDTGTVVFPGARWKFYLDARPEIRMQRRAAQLRLQGTEVNEEELLAQIVQRDKDDSERTIAPLKKANDAVCIDSSDKNAEEVIDLIIDNIGKT